VGAADRARAGPPRLGAHALSSGPDAHGGAPARAPRHHTHGHAHGREAGTRALLWTLALLAAYTVAEVVGGLLTGSLALLADAGHMLSDVLSIVLALGAIWLARRPATPSRSFGYRRAEIVAAFVNGLALVAVAVWVVAEAVQRLADPPEVLGGGMLLVALGGLVVNGVAFAILARSARESLNVEAALRHVVADALGSVGAIAAAVTILVTGWELADPLVSIGIALLILASAWGILRESGHVLIEGAPRGMDTASVQAAILDVPGVVSVHDLHVWTITSGFDALAAHVLVGRDDDCHARRRDVERMLVDRFGIRHTTLQMEHAADGLIQLKE
jgi:cobalt-zinc-cadmium efflux system protein